MLAVPSIRPVEPVARASEPSASDVEFFEKEVRPLLVEKCQKCHGDVDPKGGLALTSRSRLLQGGKSGPAAVAGKPDESLMVQVIRKGQTQCISLTGKRTSAYCEVLARWVKMGMLWPGSPAKPLSSDRGFRITETQRQFWAFRPVTAVPVPNVRAAAWPQSAIDFSILASLEAAGLRPSDRADKRTLLRRATFDLTGLPPTPAEIEAFLADDSAQAFVRVVDRLLSSPRYGERWGRHWLDVVRYADARDLIQLPKESDFREIWRYRDWVVDAFNRDLPYTDFIRHQIAGDLLPPPRPTGIYREGVIATGFLALADFVPGDVDKDQMIADYVNDQVDVVSRAFLGISVACARCHDHKFDPISTEDYYSLAGIFFSTRLIPGPIAGNTPLIRVPLTSPAEIAQATADARRRAELERLLPEAADREYLAVVKRLIIEQMARYLVAACEYRNYTANSPKPALSDVAKRHQIHKGMLSMWVEHLARVEKRQLASEPAILRDAASGKLVGAELERSAGEFQKALAAVAARRDAEPPEKQALTRSLLFRFRADDPRILTDAAGHVTLWPNRAELAADAKQAAAGVSPVKTSASIGGQTKPVLQFDGKSLLEAAGMVPRNGSLFIVYKIAEMGSGGQRLLGWEDSDVGKHGLGIMLDPGGRLHAILRNNGGNGDLVDDNRVTSFEIACVTWGPNGTVLHRDGKAAGNRKDIVAVSSDPTITTLQLGGPGSGKAACFRGDVAELRIYDRQLSDSERRAVESELRERWFNLDREAHGFDDQLTESYEELLSSRGPFWLPADERLKILPADARLRLAALRNELEVLKKKPPLVVEEAVAVQDGGPKGTRHEGFQDAHVFLRGDCKRLGPTVPRGFPRVLTGERHEPIANGSGRLQLAEWLACPDNPLTARVMVNRIWQHHFGEGLVRTPNDFGQRGERPTHPELLDYLATRFIESGWSVKAMHRLVMLSSVYQQSSRAVADQLARDPENRLFGRMNRRSLEAEAVRDSLLAVAGRLDFKRGGPAYADPTVPRRTLYLMSVRTGPNNSDFGRLFDRADPGSIVDRRGESTVAPQALYFMNDPTVMASSRSLATRVLREAPAQTESRIRHLYVLTLGRPPTPAELEVGIQFLKSFDAAIIWDRYCHMIVCTNEFVYID
jgi:hypothetical protein